MAPSSDNNTTTNCASKRNKTCSVCLNQNYYKNRKALSSKINTKTKYTPTITIKLSL